MQLITPRLVLRDFTAEDWPAVLAYQQNPLYLRYYAWTERTPPEVQAFVQRLIDQQTTQPRFKYQLAITLRATGQLIGNCGVRRATETAPEATMGYELAPEHWGQGYATEAARAIVYFGFTHLALHRIEADCVVENTASAHVLEKVGMRLEGRLREKEYFKNRWWDVLLFAILRVEWAAQLPMPQVEFVP